MEMEKLEEMKDQDATIIKKHVPKAPEDVLMLSPEEI
jgi:hypothetical protein